MRALLLLLLLPLSAFAGDPTPLIGNVAARQSLSLDGDWQTIVDPYDNGYRDFRDNPNVNGFFKNQKPRTPHDLVEYDFDKSPALRVPGDWNSQRPELFFYEGSLWYKKSFAHQLAPGRRAFLYFGAANYRSRVWLNGEFVCQHEGGFTPFNCEVTRLLKPENFVVVQVNNQRTREGVPTLNTDWWNYGGLTREVRLVDVPASFVENYFLQLDPSDPARVKGWARLNGGRAGERVEVRVPELQVQASTTTDAAGVANFSFALPGVMRWEPSRPKLYEVEVRAGEDAVTDRIGFRTIQVRGHDILLNGKSVFLRGICMHAEAPYRSGRAHGEPDARVLLGWVRELGGNFARLAHYPHDEAMVRVADEMGILIWSEVPVYWMIDFDNPATLASARRQAEAMVLRDHNRASLVLWSVANETPVNPARNAFLEELVATVRGLDSTRLLTAAMFAAARNPTTRVINDPLGRSLDVLAINEYIGWYEGKAADADRISWESPYGKPLIVSEFGGDAKYGLHGSREQRWTEEFQQEIYEHQLAMISRIPFVRGITPWILMDFRSPRRQLPGVQDFYNRKGLISDKGEKKKAFFTLEKFYKDVDASGFPCAMRACVAAE